MQTVLTCCIPKRSLWLRCCIRFLAAVVLLAGIAPVSLHADELPSRQSPSAFSFRWENDTFGNTDENYTNGVALALTYPGRGIIGGVWDVMGEVEGSRYSSFDLGQLLFTPTDTSSTVPDPADRPYAGFLYLGTTTFLQRNESLHGFKLAVGVVGPASMGEALQKVAHRALLYRMPQGWDSQIKNEPIVNLHYEYRHRFSFTPRAAAIGVEMIPVAGAALGNFLTEAQAELQLRVGYWLPDDFGTTVLRGIGTLPVATGSNPSHDWGIYAFAGGCASLVAWNITLDGNTLARSPNVDKRIFLPAAEFGATLWTRRFQASFSYVMLGEEFYGQKRREDYGSILLSYVFP
ncbi:MAG: DUF2219 family protein [Geobacter sp.]|nr:DUF2219 family protein [Geobacter sp.]